ncbi:MAG: CoA transferase [SAR202 cluster bacterium]|nr:CoA transferase [SAR202 cluster bacterium]HAE33037.1 hypothetical protein [Dehalococcoidia bacterium]
MTHISNETKNTPLDGVRVLDLCVVLAGPTCGRTLAQYGAEVIKVDPAHRPPQLTPWMDVGRGKRSISLNLMKPGGLETFLQLADSADVILEGFRKGVADRLGIGYETLKERNPGIVYGSINCFGQEGPWDMRPGFEQNAQAATGIQLRNAGVSDISTFGTSRPRPATFTLNDYGTGISAAFAVMLALLERKKTGLGQRVEAALSYTSALLTGPYHVDYEGFQRDDIGGPGARGTGALNRLYECSDGWLLLSVSGNIELNALKATPYFSEIPESPSCGDLQPIFREKSTAEWETILTKAGVPAVRNTSAEELHADPSNRKRHLVCSRDYRSVSNDDSINAEDFRGDPSWGITTWPGNPVNMSGSNLVDVQPPLFGADTDDVLVEAGLSQDDLKKLRSAGAIPASLPIPLR